MAGAVKLSMTRAKVTTPAGITTSATVTVQDGVATIRTRGAEPVTMAVAKVERTSAKRATITGADGTTWEVQRGCGCGGGG